MESKAQVVILSYNHPGITKQCIQSAFNFFKPSEIILVHNGSRLENVEILQKEFPEITHLIFTDNKGYSGGANRGINFAVEREAEVVFFLSNDTKLTRWNFQAPAAKKFIVAPKVELRDTGRTHSLGGKVSLWRGALSHLEDGDDGQGRFYVPGSAFVVSRGAWLELEGFDEKLGSYWEDVDLSLRARKSGIELGSTTEIVVKHGVAKTTGGDPFYTLYSFHRNRRRVVTRHSPLNSLPLFYLIYSVSSLRKLFKFIKNRDFKRVKLLLKASIS